MEADLDVKWVRLTNHQQVDVFGSEVILKAVLIRITWPESEAVTPRINNNQTYFKGEKNRFNFHPKRFNFWCREKMFIENQGVSNEL